LAETCSLRKGHHAITHLKMKICKKNEISKPVQMHLLQKLLHCIRIVFHMPHFPIPTWYSCHLHPQLLFPRINLARAFHDMRYKILNWKISEISLQYWTFQQSSFKIYLILKGGFLPLIIFPQAEHLIQNRFQTLSWRTLEWTTLHSKTTSLWTEFKSRPL